MIVTGASAGPKDGELPIGGASAFSAACAIPNRSRREIQISNFFIIADKKGDTLVSPFPHDRLTMDPGYIFPTAFIHLGYRFFAVLSGTMPFTMIWNVPGFASVPR